MGRKAVGILVVSWAAAIGAPAWAHHSMVAYEPSNTRTPIEGVVTSVKWTNPHMFIELAMPTADGKTETWLVEGGGVAAAIDAGISPKLLKVGTKVKVLGGRHLDPSKHMMILNSIEVDGKSYGRNAQTNSPR